LERANTSLISLMVAKTLSILISEGPLENYNELSKYIKVGDRYFEQIIYIYYYHI